MVRTRNDTHAKNLESISTLEMFKEIDNMYVGPHAIALYTELEKIAEHGIELVAPLLPHLISIFELLTNKSLQISQLEKGLSDCQNEIGVLEGRVKQKSHLNQILVDESFSAETEYNLIRQENVNLKSQLELSERIRLEASERDSTDIFTPMNLNDDAQFPVVPQVLIHRDSQTDTFYCQQCLITNQRAALLKAQYTDCSMRLYERNIEVKTLVQQIEHLKIEGLGSNNISDIDAAGKKNGSIKNGKPLLVNEKASRGFLFCDSMGRSLGELCNVNDDSNMCCYSNNVFPNATLDIIAKKIYESRELNDLGKRDFVFVMGDANNFTVAGDDEEVLSFVEQVEGMISALKHTNLVLSTVPYRYDLNESSTINMKIKESNTSLREIAFKHNIPVFDLYTVERNCHTRHGFHINLRGKRRIAKFLVGLSCTLVLDRGFKPLPDCADDWIILDETSSSISGSVAMEFLDLTTDCNGRESNQDGCADRNVSFSSTGELCAGDSVYVSGSGFEGFGSEDIDLFGKETLSSKINNLGDDLCTNPPTNLKRNGSFLGLM